MDFDLPILTDDEFGTPPPKGEKQEQPAGSARGTDVSRAVDRGTPPGIAESGSPASSSTSVFGAGGFVRAQRSPGLDTTSLLADLTPPQQQAVLHTEGPLLVLAAAGSGKTRVITRRIANLIGCGVPPWNILAVTFTNKAAGEMRERIHHVLGGASAADGTENRLVRGLTVTTFHSLCARLLRRYAEAAGLKPDFSIYDTGDQLTLIKKSIEAAQLSTANFQPRSVLSVISNAKNDLIDANAFAADAMDFSQKSIAKVYISYTRRLREANAVDFDDLLLLVAKLLNVNPEVRGECQRRWQYLLIDEYQDTNQAQFQIASLIAGESGPQRQPNICVVGDPDQAIYGWRGADISNILDFEKNFPAASVIKLGENFRSSAPILACADTLIKHNKNRKQKPLFTSKAGGEKIEVTLCRNEQHEAQIAAAWLKARHDAPAEPGRAPIAWRDMAVFYRTNALSRVMEEAMRSANIPYTIARGTSFYDREEVKNALSYLRVVANQADSVSLARIVNVPTRAIGDTTFDKIDAAAERYRVPVLEMMRNVSHVPDLTARAVTAVGKFVAMMNEWTGGGSFMGASVSGTLADLVDRVLKESGLETMYRAQAQTTKSETDLERLDNLAELVSSARQFEQEYDPAGDASIDPGLDAAGRIEELKVPPLLALLRAFLESISLVADADAVDPAQGSVTLMTLHAAKGLEFPAVVMVGLEEGLLPHMRSRESEAALEEERRLCFVGVTRAMRRLLMTAAKYRTQRGMSERTIPSRFLDELPREHVKGSDQSDEFADLEGTAWSGGRGGNGAAESSHAGQTRSGGGTSSARTDGWESGGRGSTGQTQSPFPVGSSVRHPQFGVGVVQGFTGGSQARVTVAFKGVGTKTLVLEYARLTKV
jgi:DNA helicase-2/ATP-dependent DNA helicase PcrA